MRPRIFHIVLTDSPGGLMAKGLHFIDWLRVLAVLLFPVPEIIL